MAGNDGAGSIGILGIDARSCLEDPLLLLLDPHFTTAGQQTPGVGQLPCCEWKAASAHFKQRGLVNCVLPTPPHLVAARAAAASAPAGGEEQSFAFEIETVESGFG